MKRKTTKSFLSFFVLIGLALLLTLWQEKSEQETGHSGGLSLTKPAFAQQPDASFLEQEAGIAVYTDLGREIDLSKAKAAFKIVEKETGTYLVGSFSLSKYKNYGKEDIHCFIHRDGWLVVYYPETDPIAKMVNWQDLGNTRLEMGLSEVCSIAGVAFPYMKYYHFKYPDATKFMMVAKWRDRTFRMMIPGSFIVYERSWSTSRSSGSIEIDGTRISGRSGSEQYGTYGLITPTQLKQDAFHTIGPSDCAVILVYRES